MFRFKDIPEIGFKLVNLNNIAVTLLHINFSSILKFDVSGIFNDTNAMRNIREFYMFST